jgi:DNA-binding transcriptional ArsR family regulator/uncharacterized protein YndB with AHSA1/START domain
VVDAVFKALADPTRRFLLDALREQGGQTLGELCERVDMTRQSATKHLSVLESANLISTVRRGREKLHYLNPVPLHEMQERWIDRFERPRLRALGDIKRRAEDAVSDRPTYVYTTNIESTPERVWEALTDPDLTARFWGHRNESGWQVGDSWRHVRTDGSGIADGGGTVLEADPPRRLRASWDSSVLTFEIEAYEDIVKLTLTHSDLAGEQELRDISLGWPAVLANLKTFLESGRVMAQAPWEMHR